MVVSEDVEFETSNCILNTPSSTFSFLPQGSVLTFMVDPNMLTPVYFVFSLMQRSFQPFWLHAGTSNCKQLVLP